MRWNPQVTFTVTRLCLCTTTSLKGIVQWITSACLDSFMVKTIVLGAMCYKCHIFPLITLNARRTRK